MIAAVAATGALLVGAGPTSATTAVTNVPVDEAPLQVGGTLIGMTTSPLALTPAFQPATYDYVLRCQQGVNNVTFSFTSTAGSSRQTVSLGENQAAVITTTSSPTSTYWVRCLPHDFPQLAASGAAQYPGWYLTGNLGPLPGSPPSGAAPYAMVLDGNGTPVWYQKQASAVIDNELVSTDAEQPVLAWAPTLGQGLGTNMQGAFVLHNLSNQTTSQVPALPNSIEPIDPHELLQLGSDWMTVSTPQTTVSGQAIYDCVINKFDASGTVVWTWTASAHINLNESDPGLASVIGGAKDVFHCNSIDVNSTTGEVLVSMRNTDSIYDINPSTSAIKWKLAGSGNTSVGNDNEPVLTLNDPDEHGFFGQHDARFEPAYNSSYLFDVSLYDDHTGQTGSSRGVEFAFTSTAATWIQSWSSAGNAAATGSFRRYQNGHDNLVGWGFKAGSGFTEFTDSTQVFSVSFTGNDAEYRVLKFPLGSIDPNVLRQSAGLPRPTLSAVQWQPLGGVVTSKPGAASWGPGRRDVFVRGSDNQLWHMWFDNGSWSNWEPLGGVLASGPGVAAWGPNRLDVFVEGTDKQLWHKWWDGGQWNGWEPLGGVLSADPAVASWGPNRLDVLVRGTDNQLWHKWWDGGQWNGWEPLPGETLSSDPGAVSWGSNRVDVFAKGSDSQLWHKWWDGVQWNGWESLGGNLTSGPAAASTAPGELNVVAVGAGSVPERSLYSNGWFGWQPMGGLSAYTPASTPLDSGSQDVFVTGTDGQLWYGQLAITTQPPSMMPVARPYAAAARL